MWDNDDIAGSRRCLPSPPPASCGHTAAASVRGIGFSAILLGSICALSAAAGPSFADSPTSPEPAASASSGSSSSSGSQDSAVPLESGSSVPTQSPAESGWELVAEEQGIEVYERRSDGRELPMFRASGEIRAGVEDILTVLQRVEAHPEWMPDCAEARVLRREDDALIVYRRTETPWPLADRDVVLRSQLKTVSPGEVHVYFRAVEDSLSPPIERVVRMPRVSGHYKIRALGPDRAWVEYQVDADPGGRLPRWVATTASRENPIRTLTGLRAHVERLSPPHVATPPR